MTTELPTPQIPQSLHAAMADWGRHTGRLGAIDAEAARLDGVVTDLQRQLTEATGRLADLGRQRHAVEGDAAFARSMVEHGCQLAGIAMPEQPPAAYAPAASPPADVPQPGGPFAPPTGPEEAEALAKAQAFHAMEKLQTLGQPVAGQATAETVTDPRSIEARPQDAGGDQPAEPGFQPEQPPAEQGRRRGGRRNG